MDMVELRQLCRRESDYIITMFITNRLALWLTYLMLPTKITPNQVTLASLGAALVSAVFFAYGYFILGALGLFLSHILDCTDGNLARAKRVFSIHGKLLDMIADRVGESSVFLGLAFYYWPDDPELMVLSLLDGLLLMLYYYLVDIPLCLIPGKADSHKDLKGWAYDGVRLKWGIMEPVIYGFVFFALIDRVQWQLYLLLPVVLFGLGLQLLKTARLIHNS